MSAKGVWCRTTLHSLVLVLLPSENMLCVFFFRYILQLLCVYVRHLKSHIYVNSLVYFRCFLLLNIAQNFIEYTIAPLQPIVFNFDSPTPPFVRPPTSLPVSLVPLFIALCTCNRWSNTFLWLLWMFSTLMCLQSSIIFNFPYKHFVYKH